jgi:hypothetical protein
MAERIVALVSDLLFSSRIEATLGREGYQVLVVEDMSALEDALAEDTALVILDLHAGTPAAAVVAACGDAPVLAFGRHTEPALLRAAREGGCVEVVPRSTFVEELTTLVNRLTAKVNEKRG